MKRYEVNGKNKRTGLCFKLVCDADNKLLAMRRAQKLFKEICDCKIVEQT